VALSSISLLNLSIIEDYGFNGYNRIKEFNLPKVTSVGKNAFGLCSCLLRVNLPLLQKITEDIFYKCESL
jgi:hypothetical protein